MLILKSKHRLLCGDSTAIDQVERLMDGEKAQTFFTDPPYGDNVGGLRTKSASEKEKEKGKSLIKRSSFIENDKEIDFLENVFDLCVGFLTPINTKMVFFKWDKFSKILSMASVFGKPSALCVWDRVRRANNFFRFQPQHELCLHWGNQEDKKEPMSLANVWHVPKELENKELHPTVKPIAILDPVIRVTTEKSQIVLDLFLGSGSTLIACEKTGRRCFGMEIDPHYCDVIVERYKKFCGKEVVKF
jgi:DNA modification methylase